MEPVSVALLLVLLGFLALFFVRRGSNSNLPPGPYCLPFIGYVPYVLAEFPHQVLERLKVKYGNIFGLQIGSRYCVVINDFKSFKESFNNKCFLDRPPNYTKVSAKTLNYMELDVPNWGDHYQFIKNWLRLLGTGDNRLEEIVLDELSRVLPRIEAHVGKPEFNIREAIHSSLSNTIFQLLFTRWFEDDHPMMTSYETYQRRLLESFSNNMARLYYPVVAMYQDRFDTRTKLIFESAMNMEEFVRAEVIAREKIHHEGWQNDYIDVFLTEMKKRQRTDPNTTYTTEILVVNIMILLLGGADTVRNALEFVLMGMATHPEIQEKVHQELDSVLGSERTPLLSDKSKLPYTEAAVLESQRWMAQTPVNLLRMSTDDTKIQGYHVPKGALLIHNMWSCNHDPSYWPDPHSYKPERFLSKDLKKVVVPECFVPFSLGKRACPGEKMAAVTLFLYFATIMHKFTFSAPTGGVDFAVANRINAQALRPIVKVSAR